jgi:ligand-binding sensor domain-containing protein
MAMALNKHLPSVLRLALVAGLGLTALALAPGGPTAVTARVGVPAGVAGVVAARDGHALPAELAMAQLSGSPAGRWETFASGNDVLSLVIEGDTLWAGTRAGGLVRWDLASGTYTQFLRPQDPLVSNTVVDLALTDDGVVWMATDMGLAMLDDRGTPDKADDVWHGFTRESTGGGLPSDDVRAVAVDGDLVWIGTWQVWDPTEDQWRGGGLARLDTKGTVETADDTWMPVATYAGTVKEAPDGTTLGLVSDNINDIVVTGDGDLFVATSPHWLYEQPPVAELPPRWTRVHGGISHLDTRGTTDPLDDSWTATDCEDMVTTVTCQVQALAYDGESYVWAAIGGRGVMYFPETEKQIIDESSRRFDLPEGVADDFVEAIAFGPAGDPELENTVWLARRKGGVSVLDHNGTLRRRTDDIWTFDRGSPLTMADGLARDRTQAVAIGRGKAWIGTGPQFGIAGGISAIDLDDQLVSPPMVTDNAPPTNFITRLAFGEPGSRWSDHVWIATGSRVQQRFGAGVVALDTQGTESRDDDTWAHYTMLGTDADGKEPWSGLAGDNVQAIMVRGDEVWIGSAESLWDDDARRFTDGGLSVFDGEAWTARTVDNTGGEDDGLRCGSVSSVESGCDGEVWIGTGDGWSFWGAGVDVLTPGDSIHVLSQDTWQGYSWPDLTSNNTTGVDVDCARGRVWVAAEHHVTRANPERMETGGLRVGGGVAVLDVGQGLWTQHTAENGLECFDENFIDCEATDVRVSADGDVWVGTYGTRDMETAALVEQHPFYPAVVNVLPEGAPEWLHEVLDGAGQVAAMDVDPDGRLWVATSRGGTARDSARPENWRIDRERGGLIVHEAGTWRVLDVMNSGVPSNDISDVAVAPNGDVWVATEGWGLARFQPHGAAPTPTPTSDAPTPTATLTPPVSTPSATATGLEPTPTGGPTGGTPSGSATPTATPHGGRIGTVHLPRVEQHRGR